LKFFFNINIQLQEKKVGKIDIDRFVFFDSRFPSPSSFISPTSDTLSDKYPIPKDSCVTLHTNVPNHFRDLV
jgi:hypothetical protein